jgi:hypothetical protein
MYFKKAFNLSGRTQKLKGVSQNGGWRKSIFLYQKK